VKSDSLKVKQERRRAERLAARTGQAVHVAKLATPRSGFSAGMGMDWYGGAEEIPAGWLGCDGSAVSRTTYAALFAAIGTTFGVGDGSTTFNLPDSRKRATYGAGTGYAIGASDGLAEADRVPGAVTVGDHAQWDHGHAVYWPGYVEVAAGAGQVVSLPGGEIYGTSGASYGPVAHDVGGSKSYLCITRIIKH